MKNNHWYAIKNQSLARYASYAGFDLALYDQYSEVVQKELQKQAIAGALWEMSNKILDQYEIDAWKISKGIYVISLSSPLAMEYRNGRSEVIYIGIGNVMSRIKSHFQGKLFSLMESLSGANFDFHFAVPHSPTNPDYYKHIEYLMLSEFEKKYNGLSDERPLPLMNKNAGSNKDIDESDAWWKKPLKSAGKTPRWTLKPTAHSNFGTLD